MTVGETIKSWSLMETVISVTGLIVVLIFNLFVWPRREALRRNGNRPLRRRTSRHRAEGP